MNNNLKNNPFPHFEGLAAVDIFCQHVWSFYKTCGRSFAWRQTWDPYHIVVSEIMLQQTQTERVKEKYEQFLEALPTFDALAQAPVAQVIALWQGLGYNRRALALHKIAQQVVHEYNGILPQDPLVLQSFPGLGPATAASICAFAFNKPTCFIETNIRAVFIHSFFTGRDTVTDKELLPYIELSVDSNNPREWYYALMDYGVALKKEFKNPSRKSAHHSKQSKFEGSERQIRGMIIRELTQWHTRTLEQLCEQPYDAQRIQNNIAALMREGFIMECNEVFMLKR